MSGGGIIRGRGVTILAWVSMGFAVGGGTALASTFAGGAIARVVGIFPDWVAATMFGLGVLGLLLDLANDGIPNQLAIWMGILLPSIARAVPGRLGVTVTDVSREILGYVNQFVAEWVGTSSAIGVAATAVGISLLVARRVVRKSAGY